MDFELFHVNWAVESNERRKEVDAFLTRVFAAHTGFELLTTLDNDGPKLSRDESLMIVGDTMLIPIAPNGAGLDPDSPIGTMLLAHTKPGMWIGLALKVDDLKAVDAWVRSLGHEPFYRPGNEERYFVLPRDMTLGIRIEFLSGSLPNDPRCEPEYDVNWWRDRHPLGIEYLQTIGLSVDHLDQARDLLLPFDWPEVSQRYLSQDNADCATFSLGGALIEAMQPRDPESPLARHRRDCQGLYCLTFKVKSGTAARAYLEGLGYAIIGDDDRFAIDPNEAFGRLIYFTEKVIEGDPRGYGEREA